MQNCMPVPEAKMIRNITAHRNIKSLSQMQNKKKWNVETFTAKGIVRDVLKEHTPNFAFFSK